MAAVVFGALVAGSVGAAAENSFRTPSKQIYCQYGTQSAFLRCDVNFKTRFTHRPRWCHFGWGNSFGVHATGRASVLCVSDSVYSPTAKVILYGATRHYGPFACTSKRTGLRCRNRRGHGFQLSRDQQTLF
jgi:Family of unknown function (DUF6636)